MLRGLVGRKLCCRGREGEVSTAIGVHTRSHRPAIPNSWRLPVKFFLPLPRSSRSLRHLCPFMSLFTLPGDYSFYIGDIPHRDKFRGVKGAQVLRSDRRGFESSSVPTGCVSLGETHDLSEHERRPSTGAHVRLQIKKWQLLGFLFITRHPIVLYVSVAVSFFSGHL